MNKRLIARVVKSKHKEFVNSIKDKEVKKLVEKNSIVTGGAIVSLLLSEKPSDFDYYFTDKNTTLAVAKYYVDQFNKTRKKIKNPRPKAPKVILDGDRIRIRIQSLELVKE